MFRALVEKNSNADSEEFNAKNEAQLGAEGEDFAFYAGDKLPGLDSLDKPGQSFWNLMP